MLGVAGGFVYAWLVLWALRSLWVGAVTVPFLTFHWTLQSLVIGSFAGWGVAAVTLWQTARGLTRLSTQDLLSQRDTDKMADRKSGRGKLPLLAGALGVLALVVGVFGATAAGQIAAGAFVGGGMLLLVAALVFVYCSLRSPNRITKAMSQKSFTYRQLVSRNASRHPLRSTMTIGLMATASFFDHGDFGVSFATRDRRNRRVCFDWTVIANAFQRPKTDTSPVGNAWSGRTVLG